MSAANQDRGQRLMALFTETPQIGAVEQARHYIRTHKEKRDQCMADSRARQVEQIKLDWWTEQLLLAIGGGA